MEMVWGLPRAELFAVIEPFQGFRGADESILDFAHRVESRGEFRPRDEVEEDSEFQQLIPYVLLTHRGRILVLERLSSQGESRLHHRLSVGIGGHVNPEPVDPESVDPESGGPEPLLIRGLRREVREEVCLDTFGLPELLGFVNDDSNAVGSVHFGVVGRLEVDAPIEVRETDRMRGEWVALEGLGSRVERLESWSRFVIDSAVVSGPRNPA